MGIVNRTKDQSEQRVVASVALSALGTGVTIPILQVPSPCVLEAGSLAAFGISGSPTYQLSIQRFIVGAGATVFSLGSANAAPAFGTSGVPVSGLSLPASGSTLLNLLTNDVICVTSGAANAAVTGLNLSLVVRPIQDIRKYFGLV